MQGTYSITQFGIGRTNGKVTSLTAELSDLGPGEPFKRLEDGTSGLTVRGNQGDVDFSIVKEERDSEGELACIILKPTRRSILAHPNAQHITMHLLND